MNFIRRLIPHEHQFIPILYGFLTTLVDEKGETIPHKDFYPGGCVVRDEKYICKICGKRVIE